MAPSSFVQSLLASRQPVAATDSLEIPAPPPPRGGGLCSLSIAPVVAEEDILRAASAARTLEDKNVTADAAISAARTLGQLAAGAAPHAGVLARKLGDQRNEVRQTVAWALGQLGGNAVAPHAHVIVDFLGERDIRIRGFLQNILSATGATGADALAQKVAQSDDPCCQKAATHVLKGMGADAAQALAKRLSEHDPKAKSRIVVVFSQIKDAAAPHAEALAGLLDDPDAEVKCAAAEALGNIGKAAGSHAGALVNLLEHKQRSVRLKAVAALGCLGDAAAAYTCAVARALDDQDADVQLAAVKALGQIGELSIDQDPLKHFETGAWAIPDSGLVALAQHLMDHNEGTFDFVLSALQKMGASGAAVITTQLTDKESHLRNSCLEALLQMVPKRLEVNLGAAAIACQLDHKNPNFRIWLCGALGRGCCDARGHAPSLKLMWEHDPDESVRTAAMRAITKMGSKQGSSVNVLLTDPVIVATSVPRQESKIAAEMTDTMKKEVQRIRMLVSKSRTSPKKTSNRSTSKSCFFAACQRSHTRLN